MKEVIMFRADDGSTWGERSQAEARDVEVASMRDLEALIGPRPKSLRGWVRRDPKKVAQLRRSLFAIGERRYPDDYWSKHTPEDLVCTTSFPTRVITEQQGPFSSLWWRVACIDAEGREWEQAYWLSHLDEGLKEFPFESAESGE